jgi:hypothetical protein
MSTASKVTLALSCAATLAIVSYVHLTQVQDRNKLKQVTKINSQCLGSITKSHAMLALFQGVLRDIERQQARKTENLYK